MLVLDEADRILDMGFAATLDAIIANLPSTRQTLLFSATQTKSVRDLARLSLDSPEFLAAHAEAAAPTPVRLQQAAMVVGAEAKLDVLWSFIKAHLNSRMMVFLSTCKQVCVWWGGGRVWWELWCVKCEGCACLSLQRCRAGGRHADTPAPPSPPSKRCASCTPRSRSCAPVCRCARCTAA
jgi:hypothetical protein